jgi:hypothetical protein
VSEAKKTNFTVRILLHEPATADDYLDLHDRMSAHGFLRTIEGGDGQWYELPQAEYNLPGSTLSIDEVRAKAASAAKARNDKYSVLVTAGTRNWQGLRSTPNPF